MAKQIEVTKIFNTPLDMVWKVWVDPELVKRWWGPKNFTSPLAKIDFREAGKSIVCMKASAEMGGQELYSIWEHVKIIPLKTIEFIQNVSDKDGNKADPVKLGLPSDFPTDIKVAVTFREAANSETVMTVTEYADFGVISNPAQMGLEQSLDKMAEIFN